MPAEKFTAAAVSMLVIRDRGGVLDIMHQAALQVFIQPSTPEIMEADALGLCRAAFPPEEGWTQHEVALSFFDLSEAYENRLKEKNGVGDVAGRMV